MKQQKSEIKITVDLDENNIPEKLRWEATDSNEKGASTSAALISLWDSESKEALSIDLWTKDMRVDEMKHFFYQTLLSMSNTLERATNEDKIAAEMRDFCQHFYKNLIQS